MYSVEKFEKFLLDEGINLFPKQHTFACDVLKAMECNGLDKIRTGKSFTLAAIEKFTHLIS